MPTRDWMDHIFLVRQPTPLLQYGRGSLQDGSQPSFHPTLDRSCICHIITASLSRREIVFVLQVLRETEEGIQEWLACHFACEVAGQISPHDPDGLVLSAHWVKEQAALEHLGTDSGYDCEPLRRWLCGEAAPGTVYTVKVK